MNIKTIEFKKERDFSEIINVTFSFIKENFKSLFMAMLYIAGPFILLEGVLVTLFPLKDLEQLRNSDELIGEVSLILGLGFVFLILFSLAMIAVVCQYIILYIEKGKGNFTLNELLLGVLNNIGTLFVSTILVGIATLIAFFLCILPSIFITPILSMIFIVQLYEKKNAFSAFSRCFSLVSSNGSISFNKWGTLFGIIFIAGIVQSVMSYVITVPMYVVIMVQQITNAGQDSKDSTGIMMLYVAYYGISILLNAFLQSIGLIAVAFQYFSFKEQTDGTGLLSRIENFGKNQTPAESNDEDENY